MTTNLITPRTCVIRDTAARHGRTRSVEPGVTAARYLHYGRIILDKGDEPLAFETGDHETGPDLREGRRGCDRSRDVTTRSCRTTPSTCRAEWTFA